MNFLYLAGIVLAFAATVLVDLRWRLALFRDPVRTALIVGIVAAVLVAFDLAGIALGVYRAGARVSGLLLLPELPVEEILLVVFFGYFALIMLRVHR